MTDPLSIEEVLAQDFRTLPELIRIHAVQRPRHIALRQDVRSLDYRALDDGIAVSLSSERQHFPAKGLAGGGNGAIGHFVLDPETPGERRLPGAAADVVLPRGSVLRIETPGGAGCGPPEQREPDTRQRDVREGRMRKPDRST